MGNNQAYSTFQHTIITLYNHGKLDLALLDELAEEYSDTDIDAGGDTGLTTNDGKDLEQVCIELVYPDWQSKKQVPDGKWEDWNEATREQASEAWEERYEKWRSITDERWGWC